MENNSYETPNSNIMSDSSETARLSLGQILFSFRGRINRSTYWISSLSIFIIMLLSFYFVSLFDENEAIFGVFATFIYIPLIWISSAVQIKRWHDRDKSGWFVLVNFIPIIGGVWAIIENGFLSGSDDVNRFGHLHQNKNKYRDRHFKQLNS
jgi:uncharacterized membrane protein YhaH (DUF805 family)